MDQVIAPATLPGAKSVPSIPQRQTKEQKRAADEARATGDLTNQPGWAYFDEHYRASIQRLRTLADVKFEGKTDAEIGQLTRAHHLAADMMMAELTRVEVMGREANKSTKVRPDDV